MAITSNSYTGNGSTTLYSFTFPYLDQSDVKVSLNGSPTTAYTFANATTIQFNTAPGAGVAIRIYRATDDTTLQAVFSPGSSIRASDLNSDFDQLLYLGQESSNTASSATSTANTALTTANTALSTSNTALSNSSTAVSTANSAVSTANAASSAAASAVSTANTASTNASNAVTTANAASSAASTAVSTANSATATANSATGTANTALSTANTASTNASNAVSTANTASSNATTAVATANTANTTANTALSTANTASSNANTAVTTANAAAAAVANAVLYTTVANVAAIPTTPANNTAIEVTNSTGIESFTPLSGLPGGFVGSSGLSVRIIYQTSGSTWTWIQYFPNDPETRYLKLAGGTVTGNLEIGTTGSLTFEGSTANAFETTVAVVDPTADRTITLPNVTGTVVTTGDTGSVTNTMLAGSIDKAKVTGTAITAADTGTVTSTMILDGTIVNADVNASAAIDGTKISPNFGSQNVVTTGTSSAAALIPTGSSVPTNGTYLPAANAVAIATNSTERLRIDSSGRVGIGTATPAAGFGTGVVSLDVNGPLFARGPIAASQTNAGVFQYTANDTTIRSYGATAGTGAIAFNTGGGGGSADTERARIDSSGRLLVGTSSSIGSNERIQSHTTSGDNFGIGRFSADNGGADIAFYKSRSGTVGTNTALQSGDGLGTISFKGADGSSYGQYAWIQAFVDATPGTNDYPARLTFSTTADGASSPTSRIIINSAGTLYPATDNAFQLGGGGFRFTAVYAVNGTIQTSDAREKTFVEQSSLGSDFIRALKPVSYKWKVGGNVVSKDENNEDVVTPVEGQRTHWGFIAQEVKEAADAAGVDFGGWILTDKDDLESQQGLRYDQFIAPLTKALQEALAEIDVLKAKVAALEAS